jgi:hypothetical protein
VCLESRELHALRVEKLNPDSLITMTIRYALIIAALLALGIPLVSWSYKRLSARKHTKVVAGTGIQQTGKVAVSASGIEEANIELIPAYPDRSWLEMVLSNNSDHYIVTAVIHYQITREDGDTRGLNCIIGHPLVPLKADEAEIKTLLNKYPIFPPRSKWLVGFNMGMNRIVDSLPTYEEAQKFANMEDLRLTDQPLTKVHVTLEGVFLNNGQVVGPQQEKVKELIREKNSEFNSQMKGN